MKKSVLFCILIFSAISFSTAQEFCELNATLLNQDPYPATPGDYVKLVFQIKGVDNPECNDIIFELLKEYPIEFNPGESGVRDFKKVNYIKDFESNILIPYEVRVNKDAIDGNNPIEAKFRSIGRARLSKEFDFEVEDVRADFEVYVKDYNYLTKELTIEILNIEKSDIEALTIEIPKQKNIDIKGSSRVVVGDLDSNEYTTADFEAMVFNGDFELKIIYSDKINVRRTIEKTITFDSSYFTGRAADKETISTYTYIFGMVITLLITYYIYKRIKKKENGRHAMLHKRR